ncbi:hypothetical protein [Frigoribacterium sp. MCBA15_019]|uniref:hypothetical protein n=1 Tax=Frigoribacterium sp. MCBA15_019 TaxID=1898745 RepID=UPI0015A6E681|nr:hypothetical protein [Frigoribacterium sp. MCBA15_019]
MTSTTSVTVATRFYGTGPQFDALALEVDDSSEPDVLDLGLRGHLLGSSGMKR